MMNNNFARNMIALGVTAASAFILGSRIERHRLTSNADICFAKKDNRQANFSELLRKSALPLFGSVSAAVPAQLEELSLSATPQRISQIMKFGFPSLDNIRSYSDFVLSYDTRTRVPRWVFEHLTPESVAKNDRVDRSKCTFRPDPSIHKFFSSQNSDYFRSGFDRGHMAAAGNHRRHQKHCDDTFFLTNMAPQVGPGFNRDTWNNLEMYARKLTETYLNVYICTGPLFLPHEEEDGRSYVKYQVLGENTVAVPTHFFKIIVAESNDRTLEIESYVLPNRAIQNDTPLQIFQVPPETIERASGLLFFDKIDYKQISKINGKKI